MFPGRSKRGTLSNYFVIVHLIMTFSAKKNTFPIKFGGPASAHWMLKINKLNPKQFSSLNQI